MKKDLPVLGKYLLVVAATLALLYVIAHNDAAAQAPSLPLTNPAPYSVAGALAVQVSDASWRDSARMRDIPVRIHSPKAVDLKTFGSGQFPVILFSHGLGGSREGGKLWAEHWASHGYVVVAMQHAGSDEALWKNRELRDRVGSMKAGMTLNNLGLRVGDVRFVIDEVIRRTEAKEGEFTHADPKRLGMSGHSFGAQTTLAVAGQKAGNLGGQSGLDVRIVSAIAFSPNARNKTNVARQFGDIRIPLFSITGTRDGSILDDGTRFEDRMLPYESMPAGGKYLAVFEGGDHMVFGGQGMLRRAKSARDGEIQDDVKAATLAFWNTTLKNDAAAKTWLDAGGLKSSLDAKDVYASK